MSTTTHQGAVGAETMTAAERVCHEDQMTVWTGDIVGRLFMGEYLRDNLTYDERIEVDDILGEEIRSIVATAFALASPRADSDEWTAGEDEWQRVPKEVRKALADLHLAGSISLRKGLASELAEIIKGALVAATPAQPAGAVPDSLRALLKEAADVISGAIGPQHPVAQKIDTAIASHRAGQSAGSGADTVPPLLRTAFAIYDSDPGSTVMYRHCERLSYEFVRKLLSAPDSTRTGDEGTEAIDRAIVSTLYGIDFEEEAESYEFCPDEGSHTPTEFEKALLIDFAHGLMNTVHAAVRPLVLAARPAAPEAQ